MRLYVWEGYFTDYADGLAVVLANDIKEARKLLREKVGNDHSDIDQKPKVYGLTKPKAFFIFGGA